MHTLHQMSRISQACILIVLLAWAGNSGWAQGTAVGSIEGSVTDNSGSVISGATITITDTATNSSHVQVTRDDGNYRFSDLAIGTYKIRVEKQGFTAQTYDNVQVAVAESAAVNVKMTPGGGVETVTVLAQNIPITTDKGDRSVLLDAQTLGTLPLQVAGGPRLDDTFLTLSPGVTGNTFVARINGAPDWSQDFFYDGIPYMNADGGGRQEGAGPPVDAVDQSAIITNGYSSEYGRGSGLLNFHIKSGTNQLHAAGWEYLRNNVLDSKGQFSPTAGTEKQNEFGFRVGGPVYVPRVYDGRDKTFFFALLNWYRFRGGISTSTQTLPTSRMVQGDFSELPFPIYDPNTTRPDGNGGFTRDPFPGNIIPANRLSALSAQYLTFIPKATLPGIVNNSIVNAPSAPINNRYWVVKFDHNVTPKYVFHGSYYNILATTPTSPAISGPLGSGNNFFVHAWEPRLALDQNFTPTFINQTNFSFQYTEGVRIFYPLVPSSFNSPIATPGLPYPALAISGFPTFGTGLNNNQNSGGCWPCGFFSDIVRWQHGRNAFSAGTEIRAEDERDAFAINLGTYSFANGETSLPDSPNFGSLGYSFASYYLGTLDQASRTGVADNRLVRTGYRSVFFQDDIKLTPSLTVNLGLRWDVGIPVTDPKNRISSFDPTVPNPGAGGLLGSLIGAGNTGGACIPQGGASLCRSQFAKTYYGGWQPRIGFAYRVDPKTVLRGGFGLFSLRSGAATLYGPVIAANYLVGYQYQDTLISPNNHISPPVQLQPTWDVGLPPIPPAPPLTRTSANGQNLQYMAPEDGHGGYLEQYSLTVEREFPYQIALDASYVGSSGIRLGGNLNNPNQVPSSYLALGSTLTADINSQPAQAAGILPPFAGFTGSVSQALRPFPQYLGIGWSTQAKGHSNYNSLQMRAQKSYSDGLSFLVSYTWSKTMTDSPDESAAFNATPLDTAQHIRERQLLNASANGAGGPHILSMAGTYELPIGPGKTYLNGGGAIGKLAGGWVIAPLLSYQSGIPLPISGGSPNPIFNGPARPNILPHMPEKLYSGGKFHPATDHYLNAAAFTDAGPYALGNASPTLSTVHGFAYYNENIAVIKNTKLWENVNWQFRCDFFNAFNRTQWGTPDTNYSDVASGGFGKIGSQANSPRVIQFGVRLEY